MKKRAFGWLAATVALAGFGLAATAWGQAATGAPTTPPGRLSLQELWQYGGLVMWVLAFMSVLAVAFILYCFNILRGSQVAPVALRNALLDAIRRGAIDEARRACEMRPSPLAAVALSAVDYLRNAPKPDPAALKDVMEGEGGRQAAALQDQVQYLFDIAVLSPMVGLLGTVFGMIQAFHSIALDLAKAKPMLLAAGVSEALVTTASGLIVGIPAMAFYAFFRGRASRMIAALESASTELMNSLLRQPPTP